MRLAVTVQRYGECVSFWSAPLFRSLPLFLSLVPFLDKEKRSILAGSLTGEQRERRLAHPSDRKRGRKREREREIGSPCGHLLLFPSSLDTHKQRERRRGTEREREREREREG
jgi:hypothetical protein